MKGKKLTLIIGGIVILITVLIFLIGIQNGKTIIDYVSLLFIILGECLYFGLSFFMNGQAAISQMAVTSIASVYLVINILFSLLFKNAFEKNILTFVIIHIVLICVTAIIIILANLLSNDANADEENTIKQKAVIDECERVADILLQNTKYERHKEILNTIYEDIKYGDHISDYKSGEILSVLNSISVCNDDNEISILCNQARQLIQDRNITVKQLKRGGF